MVRKRYTVQLETEVWECLNRLIQGGKAAARIATYARILLKVDQGWNTLQVVAAVDVAEGTVYRINWRSSDEERLMTIH